MDYEKMLFALHVREIAAKYVDRDTVGMTPDQLEAYRTETVPRIIANIVEDIEAVSDVVEDAKHRRESAASNGIWERLGRTV